MTPPDSLNKITFGDPQQFSIQSGVSEKYSSRGQMALGYFIVHIRGCQYGVLQPDATLLACSFNEVLDRMKRRGTHIAPFSDEPDAEKIAQGFYTLNYGGYSPPPRVLGLSGKSFNTILRKNHIQWAPDGDEAFDDGSYILQFDIASQVRLIGFRTDESGKIDPSSLNDILLDADTYYDSLHRWSSAFLKNWLHQ